MLVPRGGYTGPLSVKINVKGDHTRACNTRSTAPWTALHQTSTLVEGARSMLYVLFSWVFTVGLSLFVLSCFVTFFVPRRVKELTCNHNESVSLKTKYVHYHPTRAEEVSAIITSSAIVGNIRAVGSAKSNTRCLEVDQLGGVVRLDKIDTITISDDRTTVTAGAGVMMRTLADHLTKDGLQLYSAVEIGNVTLGAAVSGSTILYCFPNHSFGHHRARISRWPAVYATTHNSITTHPRAGMCPH